MTLIAEDLLLLVLDDEKGSLETWTDVTPALGGALLVELALLGAVEVEEKQRRWSSSTVRVVAGASVDDPLLVDGLAQIAAKERGAQDLVNRLGKKLKETLLERLAERGILERREARVLGLFPRTTWPAADSSHEDAVRRRLDDILLRGLTPDDRSAAVIALLSALDFTHRVVRDDGVPARQIKRRAQEIAEGDWAAKAVKDAVSAAQAATVAAITAAGAAAASS